LRRNVEAVRAGENCAKKRKHSPLAMVNGTRTVFNITTSVSQSIDSFAGEDMVQDQVHL
jgi:hypothetical protein